MHTIRMKNTGKLPLHGRKPGEEWDEPADADGVPLKKEWRKRLADEQHFKIGAVAVLSDAVPAPAPATPTDKG